MKRIIWKLRLLVIAAVLADSGLVLAQSPHDTAGLVGFIRKTPFNLQVLPPASGVRYFKNGIVFLSNTKFEGKMLPTHVSFGSTEAYTALLKDTVLGMHIIFSPSKSFDYPTEAVTFTSDYRTMYYTKIAKKEKREKIYKAEYKQDSKGEPGWITDDVPLEFCTGSFIYTHPALSDDGKMMIFVSDMTGTNGAMDLFLVRKNGDKWSKPENLGKAINTIRYECFPYLDADNNLYYSSDGLAGYGGYDIFSCHYNGVSWDKPINLSKKINSEADDIAFSIDRTDGRSAMFTTRQKTGREEMKLYRVSLAKDSVNKHLLTLAYIYNGIPQPAAGLLAATAEETKPPVKEEEKPKLEDKPRQEVKKEVKKEEPKPAPPPPPPPASNDSKIVIIQTTSELPAELKDKVIYRIQFLSTSKPRSEKTISFGGVTYKTYEYFYLNLYRYTVGEFTTLAPAKELQAICRKEGYQGAFVAAFKNNMRTLDLTLFK
jgi:hypothetical protein